MFVLFGLFFWFRIRLSCLLTGLYIVSGIGFSTVLDLFQNCLFFADFSTVFLQVVSFLDNWRVSCCFFFFFAPILCVFLQAVPLFHLSYFSAERERDKGKLPYVHCDSLQQQDLLVNVTIAVSWYAIHCIHSIRHINFLTTGWTSLTGESKPQSLCSSVFCVYQRQLNQRGSKCVNDKICESTICYYSAMWQILFQFSGVC